MKVGFKTFGCSANFSESEGMMGLLSEAGYTLSSVEDADTIVVNVCTVKGDTNAFKEISDAYSTGKKIIVAGCITSSMVPEIRNRFPEAGLINTANVRNIVNVVSGGSKEEIKKVRDVKANLPRVRLNPIVGIVPILSGCVDHCTYCSVWIVKGKLQSYPYGDVIAEVTSAVKDGCSEIWLTSQDNGAYGLDNGSYSLVDLLQRVLEVPGDFKVRLGMTNPHHIIKMLDPLISVFKNPKMFKFLHVPIQSGNDRVLSVMKRMYTVDEFRTIVDSFRKEIPSICISTDIISGFPTETLEESNDTVKLLEELNLDVVNISKFAVRPGTLAAGMEPVKDLRSRSREVTKAYEAGALIANKKWIGKRCSVIVDEKGKNGSWIGRNESYKPVILFGDYKIGDVVDVEIEDATSFDLRG